MPDTDRWFLSDCEGRLAIWREAALRHVRRDEDGEIDGYSLPASYRPTDLITEWDLNTWDPGQDEDDDKRRALAARIVIDHNENEQLRAALAKRPKSRLGEQVNRLSNAVGDLERERDEARAQIDAARSYQEALETDRRNLTAERDQLRALLRDLVDPGPCSFDHHGGCQTHGYLSLQPGERCPHAEAKELLALTETEAGRG
ncbi:hypothetical protein [Actinomadura bangladeshensis]|uniref:Uncharacterized protein n=1 Tax=Actinomadura bangladeshensis TaxID=453573 RepID=A0A6L9QAZ8_9ACTN|nr:hypothetical protein [Actinomadura bangladeshensis]NEA22650.1 hypothetical protein [Actinomadura bangladeshensis]